MYDTCDRSAHNWLKTAAVVVCVRVNIVALCVVLTAEIGTTQPGRGDIWCYPSKLLVAHSFFPDRQPENTIR